MSHLIGCETINILEIFSGVHGFMGKTVKAVELENAMHSTWDFLRE